MISVFSDLLSPPFPEGLLSLLLGCTCVTESVRYIERSFGADPLPAFSRTVGSIDIDVVVVVDAVP